MKKHHCINLRWPLIFLPLDLHVSTIGFRAVVALGMKMTERPIKCSSLTASWKSRQPSPMQPAKHGIALQTHQSDREISSFPSAFEGSTVLPLNLQKAVGRLLKRLAWLPPWLGVLNTHPFFGCSRCPPPSSCSFGHFQKTWASLTLPPACTALWGSVTGYTFVCWVCGAQAGTYSQKIPPGSRYIMLGSSKHGGRGAFDIQHP